MISPCFSASLLAAAKPEAVPPLFPDPRASPSNLPIFALARSLAATRVPRHRVVVADRTVGSVACIGEKARDREPRRLACLSGAGGKGALPEARPIATEAGALAPAAEEFTVRQHTKSDGVPILRRQPARQPVGR
jgi:hypothetical protein